MTGFIGGALKALFDEGAAHKALIRAIGRLARRRPVVLTELRDASEGEPSRPVYRWEISFESREELMRFDSAITSAAEAAYEEEA